MLTNWFRKVHLSIKMLWIKKISSYLWFYLRCSYLFTPYMFILIYMCMIWPINRHIVVYIFLFQRRAPKARHRQLTGSLLLNRRAPKARPALETQQKGQSSDEPNICVGTSKHAVWCEPFDKAERSRQRIQCAWFRKIIWPGDPLIFILVNCAMLGLNMYVVHAVRSSVLFGLVSLHASCCNICRLLKFLYFILLSPSWRVQ